MRCMLLLLGYLIISGSGMAQQQMGPYMAYGPEAKYFSTLNYKVYQSRNGYLWFGTTNGLIRFDGKRYINYFSDYSNPNSPSDNTIFDIAEDKNGNLWFAGFYKGLTRYDQRTGQFKKYPVLSKDNNPYYGINRIVSDAAGGLWFATSGRGLAKYIFEKDSFEFYFPQPNECKDGSIRGFNHITDIEEDKNDRNILWVGAFNGLYSFDKAKKIFTYYNESSKADKLITSIEQDRNGLLWLGSWGEGLHCFDKNKKQFLAQKVISKVPIVYDLTSVNDSIVYAACLNDGLYQLNVNTGVFDNITPPRNPADPASAQPDIQKVSLTPDAGIFIGGNYYVYQQHPAYVRLKKNISFTGSNNNTLLNGCLWDEKRQQYWLAATGASGMYALDKNLETISPVACKLPTGAAMYFYGLSQDGLNRIWVLNYNSGMYCWNEEQKMFTRPSGTIPLPDSIVRHISKLKNTRDGNMWMLNGTDLIYWNVKENKMENFPVTWDKNYTGLRDIQNAVLETDPDGNAWLFTKNGLFNCRRNEKKVYHIFKTGTGLNDLASAIVLSGAFNNKNDLWITSGNGIQVINWKDYSVLSNHDVVGGLPSMLVRGICTDSAGRVWASLASGLGLFDPKTKAWQLFNRLDGLQKDYLDNSIFITSNNHIVVNQVNGFMIKDISDLMPESKPPLLHITSIRINHEPYTDSLLPEFIPSLELPYDKNNIDIEFAAMDWIYPFKTGYRYRIEGLASANTWNPNPEARISLIALPPGKYVLHLQALNGNGIWSAEIIFPIRIKPPFWKTWWFIGGCIVLLAFLFYQLYRYRINRIIEMQKVRNAISRDLHDEIGATLSSVNMLSAVALKKAGNDNEASPIIQQIKNAVQQAGESMDDIVWSVNPANDSVQDTFARIRKYVTELVEQSGVRGIIEMDENNDNLRLPMELRRDIYLVCKEAVNNALKYSGCTELALSISIKNESIQVRLSDNGKGFDTAILQHSRRNGIGNMQHRIAKHKGHFEIVSDTGKGTVINCGFLL